MTLFAKRKDVSKKDSNSYREEPSFLYSSELPLCHTHMAVNRQAFWDIKCPHSRTIHFFEMSISRKTSKFLEFFQSAYVVLLMKQHTYKVSTDLDFINKIPLSYLNFSHQTQHPLCGRLTYCERGAQPP